MSESDLIVIAIGGNSLIEDPDNKTISAQYAACRKTVRQIVPLVAAGHRVVVVHGNGPQVGFILQRSELARRYLHMVPLDSCVADTQGAIGYNLQMAFANELGRSEVRRTAVTVVTQALVAADDPAFQRPEKPVGGFMTEQEAELHVREDGWQVREDSGRGFRRVVPSPVPTDIVEIDAVGALLDSGFVVIAAGGGGIPVYRREDGELVGLEGVVDKDLAASLLARRLGADRFVISTAVDRVALHFGTPEERSLERMTAAEAEQYASEGHFAPGSMLPKIQAMVQFVRATGNSGIITSPRQLEHLDSGTVGTTVIA